MHTIENEIKEYINWYGDVIITDEELILHHTFLDKEDIVFPLKSDIIKMRIVTEEELEGYGIKGACGYTLIYLISLISQIKYVYR